MDTCEGVEVQRHLFLTVVLDEVEWSASRCSRLKPQRSAAPNNYISGFGGLEVACWPLVPKFAGSNPAEAVGFFRAKKSSARLPSEGK